MERKKERKVKQKEMSKRFSVPGRGGVGGDEEKGVEMSEMSPAAANGTGNAQVEGGATKANGKVSPMKGIQPPKKTGVGGPGALMDRTPR